MAKKKEDNDDDQILLYHCDYSSYYQLVTLPLLARARIFEAIFTLE